MGAPEDRGVTARAHAVAWHLAECGGYRADLGTWLEVAGKPPARILDLGCGAGRVAVALNAAGHRVTGLDRDRDLLAELAASHPEITAAEGDARDFGLGTHFGLVLAPMQLLQLFTGADERRACLDCARRHLAPGGKFAAALLDLAPGALPRGHDPLATQALGPDRYRMATGEQALSTPVSITVDAEDILHIVRRRAILPGGAEARERGGPETAQGSIAEETIRQSLKLLAPTGFERELAAAGFGKVTWRHLPATEDHMGSLVAIAEAARPKAR